MFTDEQFAAIGRVTVAAGALEDRICLLLVLARGNEGDVDYMSTQSNSRWRKELLELCGTRSDPNSRDIAQWLGDAAALLKRRHTLVHSRWGMGANTQGGWSPIGIHAHYDRASGTTRITPIPAVTSDWLLLADEMERAHQASGSMVHRAAVDCGLYEGAEHLIRTDGEQTNGE